MKSLEKKFNEHQQSRPDLSSYTNFSNAVKDGQFTPGTIRRWFNRLVDKDDYSPELKRDLFANLDLRSNPPRTT